MRGRCPWSATQAFWLPPLVGSGCRPRVGIVRATIFGALLAATGVAARAMAISPRQVFIAAVICGRGRDDAPLAPALRSERTAKCASASDRWLAIEPRPRLLELRGEAEQRRFVAVARDELNRNRKSGHGSLRRGVASRQRQDDRRLAGQVEP